MVPDQILCTHTIFTTADSIPFPFERNLLLAYGRDLPYGLPLFKEHCAIYWQGIARIGKALADFA